MQNAGVVINLDLPWNPAKLEQRIGRVHRLGQKQPVRVINFIAGGSIESGMLSLLRFKSSMFAGVLDGGENEAFMGTTRFGRFMKTVETAKGSMDKDRSQPSQAEIEEAGRDTRNAREEIGEDRAGEEHVLKEGQEIVFDKQMLKAFLRSGARLLDKLGEQLDDDSGKPAASETGSHFGMRIIRDERSGERSLNISMPDDKTVKKLVQIGSMLREMLEGK